MNFFLRCNYDRKYLEHLPIFYKNILEFFNELKTLYGYDQAQDLILFNNKEILVGGTPVYLSDWIKRDVVSIKDLLKEDGSYLSFQEFSEKFSCQTNFLQYYQIISAIPNHLLLKARLIDTVNKPFFIRNDPYFPLNNNVQINLEKAKSRDFYQLLNNQTHTGVHAGPKKWSENLSLNEDSWEKFFKSLRKVCKETKPKEFQFKLIHRIVVTKRELFKYGIKADDECCFCGDKDSIDHTFIDCPLLRLLLKKETTGSILRTSLRSHQLLRKCYSASVVILMITV